MTASKKRIKKWNKGGIKRLASKRQVSRQFESEQKFENDSRTTKSFEQRHLQSTVRVSASRTPYYFQQTVLRKSQVELDALNHRNVRCLEYLLLLFYFIFFFNILFPPAPSRLLIFCSAESFIRLTDWIPLTVLHCMGSASRTSHASANRHRVPQGTALELTVSDCYEPMNFVAIVWNHKLLTVIPAPG